MTVSTTTSKTLYELLSDVRLTLSDVLTSSNPSGKWTQDKLIEWIFNGIATISTYVPRVTSVLISCVSGQYSYDLPTDFKATISVEYPAGQSFPQYLTQSSPQSKLFSGATCYYAITQSLLTNSTALMLSSAPTTGETIQLIYTAAHSTNIYSIIESATRENPCLITWTNHPLVDNDYVDIRGITYPSWTALNGKQLVTVKSANTFTIAIDTSGYSLAYSPTKDAGKLYSTSSLPTTLYELLMVYISWCASRERLNYTSQDPDSTSLLLSQYASNADRMWRSFTEIANRMAKHHSVSGPIYSGWTMDGNDRIY